MSRQLSALATFQALLAGLAISYVVCIAGDLIFGWTMYEVWASLLPGFTWPLTVGGFFLGLLWLLVYAAYIALVFVLPYNYLAKGEQASV